MVAKLSAAFLLVAAGIHLALTPEHFREQVLYGVFFLGAALVQLALVAALVLRPSAWVFRIGVLSSGGLIATWLVTRAVAPPLSPSPEGVTFAGVVASSVELGALLLLSVALPLGRAASAPLPRFSRGWAAVAGPAFVLLFLFATGSLAHVPYDLGSDRAVPWLDVDTSNGFSFRSPWVSVAFSEHVLLGTSWAVASFLALFGVLVSVTVGLTVGLARCPGACRPQAGGIMAVAPAFLAAPTCCGAALPIGLTLGGGTLVPVLSATPWILLGTVTLLGGNLLLLRRRWRAARAAGAEVTRFPARSDRRGAPAPAGRGRSILSSESADQSGAKERRCRIGSEWPSRA